MISVTDTLSVVASSPGINWWMVASIAEGIIIVLLIILLFKPLPPRQERLFAQESVVSRDGVDLDNTLISAFKAEELYKSLLRKCHPDRFPNDEHLRKRAEELSLELGKNRRNYKGLLELKEQINNILQ